MHNCTVFSLHLCDEKNVVFYFIVKTYLLKWSKGCFKSTMRNQVSRPIPVVSSRVFTKAIHLNVATAHNKLIVVSHQDFFPNLLKDAKINQTFKFRSKFHMNNYIPIYLLSVASEVLEKIFKQQLQHFLKTYNIQLAKRFGFRAS